ncbi:hypothetical protein [Oceanisphaera avium]|uniref:Uncharacterized protein n=1 Tax=Oceanisphaera avium TaxID=1903694 RepID=A0A1Y0CYC2_9GAMM|nr:hypothetical protein [Oceanisphaera avium]ART79896.1 hypothetical protein CBP12_06790 [Oceanisphaera avium]
MLNAEQHNKESMIAGIDTRLQVPPSSASNEKLQSLGFLSFLEELQTELNQTVVRFAQLTRLDLATLKTQSPTLNNARADNPEFQAFLSAFKQRKANIEQLIAADIPEQAAHQAIIDEILALNAFIEAHYVKPATVQPSAATDHRPLEFFLGMGILFLPIIFAWFTLRKGYSKRVRWVAFIWLVVFLIATLPRPHPPASDNPLDFSPQELTPQVAPKSS